MSDGSHAAAGQRRRSACDLDEGVSGAVVGDGESQSVLRLGHLHLLRLPSDVSEDEVLQADLAPQQFLHVHFMRVERAEEDLKTAAGMETLLWCLILSHQNVRCKKNNM